MLNFDAELLQKHVFDRRKGERMKSSIFWDTKPCSQFETEFALLDTAFELVSCSD
jgi:hypothetical protein